MTEFDMREFGRLEATVDEQGRRIDAMSKKLDHLVSLADRSSGGLWVGMGLVSLLSSVVGWFSHNVLGR
jgi:hypothetical protein